MMKFEMIGKTMQEMAVSKHDAMKKKEYSCHCCSLKGIQLDCDVCAINAANKLMIAVFEDLEEYERNKQTV